MNPEMKDHPEVVNKDPYGDGWMIKIKIADPAQLDTLLDVQAYKTLVGK
jgi:glycine cleavage system H protein